MLISAFMSFIHVLSPTTLPSPLLLFLLCLLSPSLSSHSSSYFHILSLGVSPYTLPLAMMASLIWLLYGFSSDFILFKRNFLN